MRVPCLILSVTGLIGTAWGTTAGQERRIEPPPQDPRPDVRTAVAERATVDATDVPARRLVRSSDLIGMPVRDAAGDALGTVSDFVVDTVTAEIAYVLLKPVDAAGDTLVVLPGLLTDYAIPAAPERRYVRSHVRSERLRTAPVLTRQEFRDIDDQRWTTRVDDYYAEDVDVFYDSIGRDTEELNERAAHIRRRVFEIERKARRAVDGDPIEERLRERVEENQLNSRTELKRARQRRPPVRDLDTLDELEDDR